MPKENGQFCAVFVLFGINPASAVENCCLMQTNACTAGYTTVYDDDCTDATVCDSCSNLTMTRNGVTTTTYNSMRGQVLQNTTTKTCTVSPLCTIISTTRECASGYYGTATSSTAGCTACPDNATCAGGNGSTFVCAAGYYKNGTSCAECPSPGTSLAGALSITGCYLPKGTSCSDSTGTCAYAQNCYYSE